MALQSRQKVSGFGSMQQTPKRDGPGCKGSTSDAFVGGFVGKTRKKNGYKGPSVPTPKFPS